MPKNTEMTSTPTNVTSQVHKLIALLANALEIEAQIIGSSSVDKNAPSAAIQDETVLNTIDCDLADALRKADSVVEQLNHIAERLGR